jgi:hypothetical protein
MHLLKNGHPAHVFTTADRRKAAAVTNEVRQAKREPFEQERINRELEEYFARLEARRRRKREKQRARPAAAAAHARVDRYPTFAQTGNTRPETVEPRGWILLTRDESGRLDDLQGSRQPPRSVNGAPGAARRRLVS